MQDLKKKVELDRREGNAAMLSLMEEIVDTHAEEMKETRKALTAMAETTSTLILDTSRTMAEGFKEVSDSITILRISVAQLSSEFQGSIREEQVRRVYCDKTFADHEGRLRDKPSPERCIAQEKRIIDIEKLKPMIYYITAIFAIISFLAGILGPLIAKRAFPDLPKGIEIRENLRDDLRDNPKGETGEANDLIREIADTGINGKDNVKDNVKGSYLTDKMDKIMVYKGPGSEGYPAYQDRSIKDRIGDIVRDFIRGYSKGYNKGYRKEYKEYEAFPLPPL